MPCIDGCIISLIYSLFVFVNIIVSFSRLYTRSIVLLYLFVIDFGANANTVIIFYGKCNVLYNVCWHLDYYNNYNNILSNIIEIYVWNFKHICLLLNVDLFVLVFYYYYID